LTLPVAGHERFLSRGLELNGLGNELIGAGREQGAPMMNNRRPAGGPCGLTPVGRVIWIWTGSPSTLSLTDRNRPRNFNLQARVGRIRQYGRRIVNETKDYGHLDLARCRPRVDLPSRPGIAYAFSCREPPYQLRTKRLDWEIAQKKLLP